MSAFLNTKDVMNRYRFTDPRAAWSVMKGAGALKIGGKLLVHIDTLIQYESDRAIDQRCDTGCVPQRSGLDPTPTVLEPGWWNRAVDVQ